MKKLIVANWKMNPPSIKEAEILLKKISLEVKGAKNTEIVVCAPFVYLPYLKKYTGKKIALGAQNVFYESKGAYTGEVSASMLKHGGVKYVIVGHSERRAMGETNEMVNKKLLLVIKSKMTPILCVGEKVRANDGFYLATVKEQLASCLSSVQKKDIKNIVIAYEPIWAISSTENRRDATGHDFEEMRIYIRKVLSDLFSHEAAASARIIYGGSANKDNAMEFFTAGAMGLLSGKASLESKNFGAIVRAAATLK